MPQASTQTRTKTPVAAAVQSEVQHVELDEARLTSGLEELGSTKMQELLARQAEIIGRLDKLAELPNMAEAERQRAVLEADLRSAREEYAKRAQNVGALAHELFAVYDSLGLLSQKAKELTEEDLAIREQAALRLTNAQQALADVRAELKQLNEVALPEARKAWWGRERKVGAVEAEIEKATGNVADGEQEIATAKRGIAEAEEQIRVNREHRVRNASLVENFKLVDTFTDQALNVLDEDLRAMVERRDSTQQTLDAALPEKARVARELDAKRDEIARTQRDLQREQQVLDEINDHNSEAYHTQFKVVSDIETTLTHQTGEELKLNTRLMGLTGAVEACKSTLAGLVTQIDTAEVFRIKFDIGRKAAEVMARNIDQIVKGTTHEVGHDALDKSHDKMTLTAVSVGIEAEVASARLRNDAIERHDNLMRELHQVRKTGDQAMAEQAARYADLDQKVRAGYAERGIDVDMSHLVAAAKAVETSKPEPRGNVTF